MNTLERRTFGDATLVAFGGDVRHHPAVPAGVSKFQIAAVRRMGVAEDATAGVRWNAFGITVAWCQQLPVFPDIAGRLPFVPPLPGVEIRFG